MREIQVCDHGCPPVCLDPWHIRAGVCPNCDAEGACDCDELTREIALEVRGAIQQVAESRARFPRPRDTVPLDPTARGWDR